MSATTRTATTTTTTAITGEASETRPAQAGFFYKFFCEREGGEHGHRHAAQPDEWVEGVHYGLEAQKTHGVERGKAYEHGGSAP